MKYQQEFTKVSKKLFINGEYVNSKKGTNFDVINPATETVIGQGVTATNDDVDNAVASARKAF